MKKHGNTKERLMKAALRIFNEKGFAGSSTREIVEASGITKPTLYYYFGNKKNLYLSLIELSFDRFNREITRIAVQTLPPRKKLSKLVGYYLNYSRDFPQEVKLTLISFYRSDSSAPEVDLREYARTGIEAIAAVIREGMKAGVFKTGDPLRLSLQLIGIIYMQILLLIKDDNRLPSSGPDEILHTFLNGISEP